MKKLPHRPEHSAGLVIVSPVPGDPVRYRILLVQKHNGRWELPKGKLEPGEDPESAALREAQEETGLSRLERVPGFHEVIHYTYRLRSEIRDKKVDFFLAIATDTAARVSKEHRSIGWFAPAEAIRRVGYPDLKKVLHRAFEALKHLPLPPSTASTNLTGS